MISLFAFYMWFILQAPPKVWAVIEGLQLTEDHVRSVAATELDNLEMQKAQFESNYARTRHEILSSTLNRLVEAKLLGLEATKRGLTQDQLLAAEVQSKLKDPSDQDVEAFYEANKNRLGQPKEQLLPQMREYLKQQNYKSAYDAFIARLKSAYSVESFLPHLRAEVESYGHPSEGPENAPVTIVEFSDFECPYCSSLVPTLRQIQKNYGAKVRLAFRQFPLTSIHPNAQKAAEASLCAGDQGRFWEMHDLLFQEPKSLGLEALKDKAIQLKVDTTAFSTCLDSSKQAERVKQDLRDGSRAGVTGTPAIFVNGRFISGAVPYEEIAKTVDEELRLKAGKNPR